MPIWKVHKYNGLELRPLRPEEYGMDNGEPREVYGEPPREVAEPSDPVSSVASQEDAASALAALDNLGSLASLLPYNSEDDNLDISTLVNRPPQAKEKIGLPFPKKKGTKKLLGLLGLFKALQSKGYNFPSLGYLQDYLYHLFGFDGVPYETVLYRDVPPSKPGFFSSFPLLSYLFGGDTGGGVPLPSLPALPPIPEIPNLTFLPGPPDLPPINLPAKYLPPQPAGAYISIKYPKPNFPKPPPPTTASPPIQPSPSYGPPTEFSYPPPQPEGPYPPAQNSYPPPQPEGPYPPAQDPYPPPQNTYPPAQNSYPPSQNSYPPPQNLYPPPQNLYPPTQNTYPPSQNPYQPSQNSYHPSQAEGPYSPEFHPPTQDPYPPPPPPYNPLAYSGDFYPSDFQGSASEQDIALQDHFSSLEDRPLRVRFTTDKRNENGRSSHHEEVEEEPLS